MKIFVSFNSKVVMKFLNSTSISQEVIMSREDAHKLCEILESGSSDCFETTLEEEGA